MKKLIMLLFVFAMSKSYAQKDVSMSFRQTSPYLIGSGVTISVFAYVTKPEQTLDYHNFNGSSQTPIYVQDAKFYGLISGVGITITGIIGLCVRD